MVSIPKNKSFTMLTLVYQQACKKMIFLGANSNVVFLLEVDLKF